MFHTHHPLQQLICQPSISGTMRALSALILLCVSVMVALAFQSIRQELSFLALRKHVETAAIQVRKYEDAIVQDKLKIQEINGFLASAKSKTDQLTKKKEELSKAVNEAKGRITECRAMKKKADGSLRTAAKNLQNAKAQQASDKLKAEKEIQAIKQQILDRDKKFCEFVDMEMEEGRKICGVAETPK